MGLGDFPKVVVGVVIAILIVASLAIPVIADYQDGETTTYTNTSTAMMSKVGADTVTASFDGTDFKIGTTTIAKNTNVFVFDLGSIVLNNTSHVVQLRYTDSEGATHTTSVTSTDTATISVTADTLTFTKDESTPVEVDIEWCFYYDTAGAYSYYWKNGNNIASITYDTNNPVYIGYIIGTSPSNYFTSSIGNTLAENVDDVTLTYNPTKIVSNTDVYTLSVGFGTADSNVTASYNDTDYHPDWVLVKGSFSSTKQADSSISSMLGIVPLLMIAGIVLATVTLVTIKRQ